MRRQLGLVHSHARGCALLRRVQVPGDEHENERGQACDRERDLVPDKDQDDPCQHRHHDGRGVEDGDTHRQAGRDVFRHRDLPQIGGCPDGGEHGDERVEHVEDAGQVHAVRQGVTAQSDHIADVDGLQNPSFTQPVDQPPHVRGRHHADERDDE